MTTIYKYLMFEIMVVWNTHNRKKAYIWPWEEMMPVGRKKFYGVVYG